MAVAVDLMEGPQGEKGIRKIGPVSLLLGPAFKENGIVRVHLPGDVGGAQNEIEFRMGRRKSLQAVSQMRLQAQFDPVENIQPAPVFVPQPQIFLPVGGQIQVKGIRSQVRRILIRPVHIQVFRKTDGGQAQGKSGPDLVLHGRITVAGMVRMHVEIRPDPWKTGLFRGILIHR